MGLEGGDGGHEGGRDGCEGEEMGDGVGSRYGLFFFFSFFFSFLHCGLLKGRKKWVFQQRGLLFAFCFLFFVGRRYLNCGCCITTTIVDFFLGGGCFLCSS